MLRLPVLQLPNCSRTADHQLPTSAEPVTIQVPARLGAELQSLAREHGCDLFQLMFACWALMLCRESGQEEVVVGYMYHGRDAVGLDQLIGFFAIPLCVRVDVPKDQTFVSYIQAVKSIMVDAMANAKWPMQLFGSNDLLPHLGREWSADAVFQTRFLWETDGGWLSNATDEVI